MLNTTLIQSFLQSILVEYPTLIAIFSTILILGLPLFVVNQQLPLGAVIIVSLICITDFNAIQNKVASGEIGMGMGGLNLEGIRMEIMGWDLEWGFEKGWDGWAGCLGSRQIDNVLLHCPKK